MRRRLLAGLCAAGLLAVGAVWFRPRPIVAPEEALRQPWSLRLRHASPAAVLDKLAANPYGLKVIGQLEPAAGRGYELTLRRRPLQELLEAVAGLTGSRWQLQGRVVIFRGAAEPPNPAANARVRYLRQLDAFARQLTPAQHKLLDRGEPLPLSLLTPLQLGIVKAVARRGAEPADLPDRDLAASLRCELTARLSGGDKTITEIEVLPAPGGPTP